MTKRPPLYLFWPCLFVFFILLNDVCYWWAMATAFPDLIKGPEAYYYFKVQFPVAILGALFDSFSFFVTIYIIRQALRSNTAARFIGHLSIDLLIALAATCWVVFVFSISGWFVSFTEPVTEELAERNAVYQERVVDAVRQPTKNLANIYFGLVMGISAMIPTTIHICMALKAIYSIKIRPFFQSAKD